MLRSAFLLLFGLTAAAAIAAAEGTAPLPLDDPFTIRRVRLTEVQLAALGKQVDLGPLVRLPREEFEVRVRKAAETVRETRSPVQIIEAKYKAELRGTDLVGTAEWVLLNPNPRATAFVADPFKLAVRSARWADGSAAVLGVLGPGFPPGPALLVEPGRQVLTLEWSVMGVAEPGQRRFVLQVPPSPLASLELDLPSNRTAGPGDADVLVTGPFPAFDSKRRLWQFRFGNSPKLEINIPMNGTAAEVHDFARASLAARYDIEPGQMNCVFEYDLEPARGSVGEWLFDIDPSLSITDVAVNDRAGWQVEPTSVPGKLAVLRVRLRHPGPGGKVLITALAPPPDATDPNRSLPFVRPQNGLVGEERVHLHVGPDSKLMGWSVGDFRLDDSRAAADHSLNLAFAGSLLPNGSKQTFRRPPGVAVAGAAPEFTTRESLEWRIDSGRAEITATMHVRVRRGPLFYLTLHLPNGFNLTRLTTTPEDAAAFAGPIVGTPHTVTVEFQRPILMGQEVELRFELRGPPAESVRAEAPVRYPLPQFGPVGASERDGTLTIAAVPGWQVTPRAMGRPNPTMSEGPLSFPFRGHEPEGFIYLAPRPPDWAAMSETTVSRTEGRPTSTTKLTLRIPAGSVSDLAVLIPEADGRERTWRLATAGNTLANVTAAPLGELPRLLPLLAAPNSGLGPVLATAPIIDGPLTVWRLSLAHATNGEIRLETTSPLHGSATAGSLFVPLPTLVGCPSQSAAITIDSEAAAVYRFEHPDLKRIERRDTRRPIRIALRPEGRVVDVRTGGWKYEGLYQTTHCEGSGELTVIFGGRVLSSSGPNLPITLPPKAEPLTAEVAGKWVSPQSDSVTDEEDGSAVRLPLPLTRPVTFEIRYRLPAEFQLGFAKPASPLPGLPGESSDLLRTWVLGPNVTALWPLKGMELTGARISAQTDDTLVVARQSSLAAMRFSLAAIILALGVRLASRAKRPSGRTIVIAAVLLAVIGGIGRVAWEPILGLPTIAGIAALVLLLLARARPEPAPDHTVAAPAPVSLARGSSRFATTSAVIAILLSLLPAVFGQSAEPAVVYILTEGEKEFVLAPRAVLDRLDALARPTVPGVVITSARYDGEANEDAVHFRATFEVRNFSAEPATLTLPLGNTRLESVKIADTPAFPTAVKSDVFNLTVPAGSKHTITAAFTVSITGTEANRELRFTIPEVPISRLTLIAPTEARQVMLAGWRGEEVVDTPDTNPELAADLGAARVVHLRWRQGTIDDIRSSVKVKVKEACVWDVNESEGELTGCYLYRIEQGSLGRFRFNLPAEVEPTRVVVRSPDAVGGSGAVLRDWVLGPEENGLRLLRVQLQSPVEGRVLVILEAVPRRPLTRQPVFRFPRPANGNIEVESAAFALHTDHVVADALARTGLVDAPNDILARDFPGVPDLQFPASTPLRTFRPVPGQVPELRPILRPPSTPVEVSQDVSWALTVNHKANGTGTLRWSRKDEPLTMAEFDLPESVHLAEVRGADVAGWTLAPRGHVQVWFRTPVKETSIEWLGHMPLGGAPKQADATVFEPPLPSPVNAVSLGTTLRVRPPPGFGVKLDRERGWTSLPTTNRESLFRSDGKTPPPHWLLYAPRSNTPPAHAFARFDVLPTGVTERVFLEHRLPRGRPHHLVLRVVGVPTGASVETNLPSGLHVTARPPGASVREWDIDVPAGMAEPIRASVIVKLPLPKDEMLMPAVSLSVGGGVPVPPGPPAWLALPGNTSTKWRLRGTVAQTNWDAAKKDWPDEIDNLRRTNGTLWAPRRPTSSIRLVPAPATATAVASTPATSLPTAKPPAPVTPAIAPLPKPDRTWIIRVPVLLAWCAAFALLALLSVRFPHSTWPEQLALAAGLLAYLLGTSPLWALPVLVLLRFGWLAYHLRVRAMAAM